MQFEYIQVLDIFCQQLGDMYQLEGVRAPFSCRVYQLIGKGLMLYLCFSVFVYIYKSIYLCICALNTWEYHFWHP